MSEIYATFTNLFGELEKSLKEPFVSSAKNIIRVNSLLMTFIINLSAFHTTAYCYKTTLTAQLSLVVIN